MSPDGSFTPHGLFRPALGQESPPDPEWGTRVNANFDIVDDHFDDTTLHLAITEPPPTRWVSRVAGDDAFPSTVVGRQDRPYQTLSAALDSVRDGSGIASGRIILRAGPRFLATGSIGSWPAGAEYQLLTSQLVTNSKNLEITSTAFGGGGDVIGTAWQAPQPRPAAAIVADAGFTTGAAMIKVNGEGNKFSNIHFLCREPTAACVEVADSTGSSGKLTTVENNRFYGGLYGVKTSDEQAPVLRIINNQFSYHLNYGIFAARGITGANHTFIRDNFILSCGSTLGNITPTGAAIRVEGGGSSVDATNLMEISGNKISGESFGIDLAGAHSVLVANNTLEMPAVGSDGKLADDGAMTAASANLDSATIGWAAGDQGKRVIVVGAGVAGANLNTTVATYVSATRVTTTATASTTVSGASIYLSPIKDRSHVRIRKGPGGSGGADSYAMDITLLNNFFHQAGPTDHYTSGKAMHLDVDECIGLTSIRDQYYLLLAFLTTANPLMALGTNTRDCELDLRSVISSAVGNYRTSRASIASHIWSNAGISNRVRWYDPNGL